jgi:hypothetical protein
MARSLHLVCLCVLAIVLIVLNVRLYSDTEYPKPAPDVAAQLHFLDRMVDEGAAANMQKLFPEGYVFTTVLYGLTWTETGITYPGDSPHYRHALAKARHALRLIESPAGTAVFEPTLSPSYGIFYNGWSAWLQGNILALQHGHYTDSTEVQRFTERCEKIAESFRTSSTPFLCSYPGSAWPADNIVAMASLRLHDQLFPPCYDSLVTRWLGRVKRRLDPATELIPHSVIAETGLVREGARGSSQTLMLRFLIHIDRDFAREQYHLFRQKFLTTWLGLPLIREYPIGTTGEGDVDSGPVLFGVSPVASVVGLGTARVFGDGELAAALGQTHEMLGLPVSWNGEKLYAFGSLPVGDAFLAWSKAATPVVHHANYTTYVREWWRLPIHGLSIVVVFLYSLPVTRPFRRWKRSRR